jgi:Mg2+/Co2+ transporter CorC
MYSQKKSIQHTYIERIYSTRPVSCGKSIFFRKRYRLISTLLTEIFNNGAISFEDNLEKNISNAKDKNSETNNKNSMSTVKKKYLQLKIKDLTTIDNLNSFKSYGKKLKIFLRNFHQKPY